MLKNKKILAIETSGELCSVCLSMDKKIYDERNIHMKHVHSEKLVPMIDEMLKSNNLRPKNLDCVAVSVGPGSFTGLRIGLTVAKGIAFASNLPIVAVPTFDSLSLEIADYLPDNQIFAIINNANIDECYFGKYRNEFKKITLLEKVQLLPKTDVDEKLIDCDVIFGSMLSQKGINNISSPRASSVAKWTYLFGEDLLTFDYDYLEPNYLKKFKVKQKK